VTQGHGPESIRKFWCGTRSVPPVQPSEEVFDMAVTDRVSQIVEPLLADLDVTIYDIDMQASTLRITLDRSGGIDLDTIGEATRRISRALDLEDPIPGRYLLEVTSPGVERALRTPEHFAAVVGAQVRLKTRPGSGLDRRIAGELISANATSVRVHSDDGVDVDVPIDDITRARTHFEWATPTKPTGGGRRPDPTQGVQPPANESEGP
jgi:ribosome maturation factor RimP